MFNPAHAVMMVRPARFGFNSQTADSNAFQDPGKEENVHDSALSEFDAAVQAIRSAGIEVLVVQSEDTEAPDALFPNNWFSTHADGRLIVYPMLAPNRRREYSDNIVASITSFCLTSLIEDLRWFEEHEVYLEGTGSIVFDHTAKIAYAVESPRTSATVLEKVCDLIGYRPFLFHCVDGKGEPVYHTNVVLCMGRDVAIVYLDGIPEEERVMLLSLLRESRREMVAISRHQLETFCGNMLLLRDRSGADKMVVSDTAWNALSESQKAMIFGKAEPIVVSIPEIERVGGGSIRCMLAELYHNTAKG